ncbi:CitMHS family transporter [Ligilactobacillus acidipiscis]|uniref:CitMHS family transporter n=1 Tax=Ligilactobacillus acidipiscis TaxID=89059 RepID=UPI0022E58D64|nr:citrate:proton symporter [Ligilactobacillus acidipiscis]WEV57586.1 citrate:proton symporter [Ligilactobacillus acidipiscis]
MLAFLGYAMVIVFMALIMKKKMTPFIALITIPLLFSIFGLFLKLYPNHIGGWALKGLESVSVTGVMLLFAIMFFALMLDAGLFDPVTSFVIKVAKGDPVKILVGTALVAGIVSLNGDGTTTTLICCSAFIPIYKKLDLKMMNLGVLIILQNTIMNLLPWGGPTARAISVLNINESAVLRAVAPGMVISFIYMLFVAAYLGRKERKRLGITNLSAEEINEMTVVKDPETLELRRPKMIWPNAILTIGLVILLVSGLVPSVVLFIIGTAIALLLNYPSSKLQRERLNDHAGDAVQVIILIFAAGIFMGLLTGTGMANAIAHSIGSIIPDSLGKFWGLVVAFVSAPGVFFLSNDAFYFGVLPVLAETGYQYGFTAQQMGVASLMGQAFHLLSPLVAFIYLLLRLTGLDMGEWQKESAKWALGIFTIFIVVTIATGGVPLLVNK